MSNTEPTRHVIPPSKETLLRFLETLPGALFVIDDHTMIVYANEPARVMSEAPHADICGQSLWRCVPHLASPVLLQALEHVQDRHQPSQVDYLAPLVNCWLHVSLSWMEGYLFLFFQESGESPLPPKALSPSPQEHQQQLRDILRGSATFNHTEMKHQKATDILWALINAIPHFIWFMRPDGSAEYGNQRWLDFTGKTSHQLQGDKWLQLIHPDDRPRVWRAWQTAFRTGAPYEVEHRIQQGSTGAYRWFLARAIPLRDPQGTVVRWIGTCTDIDDLKRTEQQLKESEENWRVLAETVPHLVWTTRAESGAEYFNQRFYDYTGATWEQLRGMGWSHFLHPDDARQTLAIREHALRAGIPYEVEYRLREGKTDQYRWFLARAMPVRDANNQILKWFGTCTDIEDQKRIEEALRQSQARTNALMNSNLIGIFVTEETQVVEANETYLHMTGYTWEDLQARRISWLRMTPPEYLAQTEKALQELAVPPHTTRYEKEYICKDGRRLPVVVGVVALRLEPLRAIGFVLDDSAQRELEHQKDAFLCMASHELRTPLTALKGNLQLIDHRMQKFLADEHLFLSPEEREGGKQIARFVQRALRQANVENRLLNDLLDATSIRSHTLRVLLEPCDLEEIVYDTIQDLQETAETSRLNVEWPERREVPVMADKIRIGQVLANYITNALKYSAASQPVTVGVSFTAEEARVWVKDQGPGLTPEAQEQVWDRFAPTGDFVTYISRGGGGLGLSLYISRAIILQHGGRVGVDSRRGHGATFWFTLLLWKEGGQQTTQG